MNHSNKIMETNLQNLRDCLTSLSLDDFIVKTLEGLMQIERAEYLEKTKDANEKGNGHYARLFSSLQKNALTINIPRTRQGLFSPATLELIKQSREDVDELCLLLTKKGMTSRDIRDVMKTFFKEERSPTTLNKMAKEFEALRQSWEESTLEKHYLAVFMDVLFITVRRGDSYSKEGVFLAYGVREDGKREILTIDINPTESADMWGTFLEKLPERGVEKVDLFIADGLSGLEEEIHRLFPGAKFQKCVVHKMRQIWKKVRPKDKQEIVADLKQVFDHFGENATKERALQDLDTFVSKWKQRYPEIERMFADGTREYYFTYIDFPPEIRRMIYTTNSIENLNRIIRKATKNKLSFESPGRLLDYVFMVVKDFEDRKWMKYPVHAYLSSASSSQAQFSSNSDTI